VHISRLNPFGYAKLTTFVVMCKAYGCEPTVELFRGFFNLCRAGKWLNFAKRPEKHIPHLFPKVITQMAFRNFVYVEDEKDLSFLPKKPSPAFGTGSSSVVAARMKNRKYKTKGGSSRLPVKRKLAPGSSTACATRAKTSASKDDVSFLTISDEDEDLHDRCYARQAFVDNAVNRRSRKLLGVIEKLRGECDMIKERERAREELSEGLRAKCEAAMSDFEKNPTVVALGEKISTLSSKVKEHKANLDRMMLESQKWAGYQPNLSSLESQVVSLEAEKARLEAIKVSLRKEVYDVRRDRMEVLSKVVPYAAMKLIHNDDLGSLVGKLVTSAIIYRRCQAFEQVAAMKEPFYLPKVKGYRSSHKKEHNQAGNDLATMTFPWLLEFTVDPLAPVEVLLSNKPPSIQKPAPSKTQALVASSQKATPSSIPASNTMSPLLILLL
ncbi:hypothetical protein Tco_1056443, partial [Tanacetum coccineum]